MSGSDELLNAVVAAISHPYARILLALLSVAGFLISVWSLRRTFANTAVEHARFIENQWQAIYHLTLNNEKFAGHVARMFAYGDDTEKAQKGAALLMYINVLASTYNAYYRRLISKKIFESHMKSFFFYYRGSLPALREAILVEGYDEGFMNECKRWIELAEHHRKLGDEVATSAEA